MFGFGKKKKKGGGGPKTLEEAGFGNESGESAREGENQTARSGGVDISKGIDGVVIPKYTEAWGWAASAARFRGFLVVVLSVSLVCMSVALVMTNSMLSKKDYFIVGIDGEGRASLLPRASLSTLGPEMFARDFVSCFLEYNALNIEENMAKALRFLSQELRVAWRRDFGTAFIERAKQENVMQTTSIVSIEVTTLERRQFRASVFAIRRRTSATKPELEERRVRYDMSVFATNPTQENPWGFYVVSLNETAAE